MPPSRRRWKHVASVKTGRVAPHDIRRGRGRRRGRRRERSDTDRGGGGDVLNPVTLTGNDGNARAAACHWSDTALLRQTPGYSVATGSLQGTHL